MAADAEELFEGGADAAAITTALAPFFNTVDADFTFAASPTPAQGTKCARLVVAASTLRTMTRQHGATVNLRFYRFYMRVDSYPGNSNAIFNMRTSSSVLSNIRMGTGGALVLRDGSTARYTSPAMPLGEWFRVEAMIDSTNLKIRLRIFTGSNLHGTTPSYDSADQTLTTGGPDRFAIGADNGAAGSWTVLYDGVAESATDWVGPTTVSPNGAAPTSLSAALSGTGILGATLATPRITKAAALSGAGALAATLTTPRITKAAALSGTGALTVASGGVTRSADLSGTGALAATLSAPKTTKTAALAGTGALTVTIGAAALQQIRAGSVTPSLLVGNVTVSKVLVGNTPVWP